MKINNVEMQTQSSPENYNLIMTHPIWQKDPDTIGEYGCLETAKTNAHNLMFPDNYKTIKMVNDEIVKNNGYNYLKQMELYNNNVEEAKKHCFNEESFLVPEVINNILNIKQEIRKYEGPIEISIPNFFYIVRTIYKNTGHYSLIIKEDKSYFDSYTGKITIPNNNITEIIKIIF